MAEKRAGHEIVPVEFRGQSFDIDRSVFASLRFQTVQLLASADPARYAAEANLALDEACCGDLMGYLSRIPGEGGEAGDLGCSADDWSAFLAAVQEALSAKN